MYTYLTYLSSIQLMGLTRDPCEPVDGCHVCEWMTEVCALCVTAPQCPHMFHCETVQWRVVSLPSVPRDM